MKYAKLYTIECLTNMHVGNGDISYNIIDNEVEKDTLLNQPMIHASGLKGALRQHFKMRKNNTDIIHIFGQEQGENEISAGAYKFFDAYMLSRPLRVSEGNISYIPVATIEGINRYLRLSRELLDSKNEDIILDFPNDTVFFTNMKNICIEGEKTEQCNNELLTEILGERWAIVQSLDNYDLPVVARNSLDKKGLSENLWYEELVPHTSMFYFFIVSPDEDSKLDFSEIVQIGGNASVGCGYTKIAMREG